MSTSIANPFGAADSALGYLYQCRYALLLLLQTSRSDEATEISIERLDDIAFHKGATAVEMLQSKHHLRSRGNLSDASADLWKTLRVWAEGFQSGRFAVPGTLLVLVTTANAPGGSIAALLRPERKPEDETEALRRLEEIPQTSRSNDPALQNHWC